MSDLSVIDLHDALNFFNELTKYECHGERIYHYTTPNALPSILKEKEIELRFTRYDCFNDVSEGNEILSFYKKTCEHLLNNGIDESFISKIIDINFIDTLPFKEKKLDSDIPLLNERKYQRYICCFSLDKDSLPMWNYYVKNNRYQGYSLGFNCFMVNDYHKMSEVNAYFEIKKVIYEDSVKENILNDMINNLYKAFQNGVDIKNINYVISDSLTRARFVFKSEYFKHEKEIRIIVKVPAQNDQFDSPTIFKEEYTTRQGYIIPFITIPFRHVFLREIVIGPLREQKLSLSTLKTFTKQRGYSKLRIINSQIPIRY